jgi:hypothetical protein
VVRAGGFLVSELKLHLETVKSHWKQAFFVFGLAAALAFVTSCGSTPSPAATPTITVSCTPTDVTVLTTAQCTATVLNLSSTLVNWSVSGTGTGAITTGGLYTAPGTVPTNNVVTVTATSQVQSTVTATQNLTIEAATQIKTVTCVDPNTNTTPSPLVVASNSQLACTATDSNGATVAVNWTVANATSGLAGNVGIVSSQGVYTAPLVPPPGGQVSIIATSQAVSSIVQSATATVVFGSSVLSGNYVFSTTGRLPTGVFWARTGSFSAGGGAINGGFEDTNQGGNPNSVTLRRFTGSYSVGADGRGTMQFCESAGANSQPPVSCPFGSGAATAFFRIVVASPTQVQVIEFSSPSTDSATTTASGEMVSQDPTVFGSGNQILDGVYSFGFSGVSSSATEEAVAGELSADGFQHILQGGAGVPGEMEIDSGGPATLASAIYSISSNGRGQVTLNGLSFSFYPVNASRAKFIEIDQPPSGTTPDAILAGDAYKQQTSSTCGWTANIALAGTTVLETVGTASGFTVADVGAFTATNGTATLIAMDQNSGGTSSRLSGTANDNYTMDSDHCGRGTLSLAGHSYVLYIISPSSAVLQETTSGTVAHGLLAASQSGSFTDGSYAFRMEGVDAGGATGQAEVFLGQFTSLTPAMPAGSAPVLNGSLDLNDFGATQTGLPITTGTHTASTGPRSTATFPIGNPVTTTRSLVLYMVSPTLYYVLDAVATAGPAIGVINNQF